jgi:hypothetical protein
MAQILECLPSNHEALSSIPRATKERESRRKEGNKEGGRKEGRKGKEGREGRKGI